MREGLGDRKEENERKFGRKRGNDRGLADRMEEEGVREGLGDKEEENETVR